MLIPFSFMKTQIVKTVRQAITNAGSASGPDGTSQQLILSFTPAVDLNLTTMYLTMNGLGSDPAVTKVYLYDSTGSTQLAGTGFLAFNLYAETALTLTGTSVGNYTCLAGVTYQLRCAISITESGYSVPLVTSYSIADSSISSISSLGDKLKIRLYVSA
jgi:hypothetical protein